MMKLISNNLSSCCCKLLLLMLFVVAGHVHASTMIWPTRLIMNHGEKTSVLWLENQDNQIKTIQVRVFAWVQKDGNDELVEQKDVMVSPPMANIEPGAKQMIRVLSQATVADGQEITFRVIVDEIPRAFSEGNVTETSGAQGIRFQMRYSVPLFIYGKGVELKPLGTQMKAEELIFRESQLNWSIWVDQDKQKWLEITNGGQMHVHLGEITFLTSASDASPHVTQLSGYVLSNSFMRWPLPKNEPSFVQVKVKLNSADTITIEKK